MVERWHLDSHVTDDSSNGFRDLTDSYTKYAESYKTANPGAHLRQRMSPVRWFQVCMALAQRPTLRAAVFGGAVGAGKQVPLLVYRPRPWQTWQEIYFRPIRVGLVTERAARLDSCCDQDLPWKSAAPQRNLSESA